MLTVPEYNINAKQREFAGHTGRVFDVDLAEDGLCVTASQTVKQPDVGCRERAPEKLSGALSVCRDRLFVRPH